MTEDTSSPPKTEKSYYTNDDVDDIIDIILASDHLTTKLIRQNTSKGENIHYYEEIREELLKRCEARGKTFTFTATSIRTKFKKMVGKVKEFLLKRKFSSGLPGSSGAGESDCSWFVRLQQELSTRNDCKPENIFDPSCTDDTKSEQNSGELDVSGHIVEGDDQPDRKKQRQGPYIPPLVATPKLTPKQTQQQVLAELSDALKLLSKSDSQTAYIEYLKEEAAAKRRDRLEIERRKEKEAELDRAHQLQMLQCQMAHYPVHNTSPTPYNSQKSPHPFSPTVDQYHSAMRLLQSEPAPTTPQRHSSSVLFSPHPSEAIYKKALSDLESKGFHHDPNSPETPNSSKKNK